MATALNSITDVWDHLSIVQTALVALVVVALIYTFSGRSKYNLPPGPTGLPILGNLIQMRNVKEHTYMYWMDMVKKYGPIYKMKFGHNLIVFIHDIDLTLDALVKRPLDFANRPQSFGLEMFSSNYNNIIHSPYNSRWQLHRKIASKAFRNYIMGPKLEEKVHASMKIGLDAMQKEKGAFDPFPHISLLVANIICSMLFNKHFQLDDPEFKNFTSLFEELLESFGRGFAADFFPILRHIPSSKAKSTRRIIAKFHDYVAVQVNDHRNTFHEGISRDLVDDMIQAEIEARREDSATMEQLSDFHTILTVNDIFVAGIDTSRYTMYWTLLFMADNPDVQQKIHAEIDEVVGTGRYPKLSDKASLNYTEATLMEAMRMRPITPSGVARAACADTKLGGYDIPKGAWLFINTWTLHNDPKVWSNPEVFRPERFLEKGKLGPKPDNFMPFMAGRRVCLGEAVAKPELSLMFACIMQRFTISTEPGQEVDLFPNRKLLLSCLPVHQKIILKERL